MVVMRRGGYNAKAKISCMKIRLLSLSVILLSLGCLFSQEQDHLKFSSYFEKGFGRMIAEDVTIKELVPPPRVKKQDPSWRAYKVAGSGSSGEDPGIEIVFFTPEAKQEYDELANSASTGRFKVIGHESILADGEASLTSEVDHEDVELVTSTGWHAQRVFVVRKTRLPK